MQLHHCFTLVTGAPVGSGTQEEVLELVLHGLQQTTVHLSL